MYKVVSEWRFNLLRYVFASICQWHERRNLSLLRINRNN